MSNHTLWSPLSPRSVLVTQMMVIIPIPGINVPLSFPPLETVMFFWPLDYAKLIGCHFHDYFRSDNFHLSRKLSIDSLHCWLWWVSQPHVAGSTWQGNDSIFQKNNEKLRASVHKRTSRKWIQPTTLWSLQSESFTSWTITWQHCPGHKRRMSIYKRRY